MPQGSSGTSIIEHFPQWHGLGASQWLTQLLTEQELQDAEDLGCLMPVGCVVQ